MAIRLHLLSSASTPSTRAIGFPADEKLDVRGWESLSRLRGSLPTADAALRSPAVCAGQTAEGLGVDAIPEPLLRDCDFGRWAGCSLESIQARESDALALWIEDAHAAPHGGESFADIQARVGGWMDGLLAQPKRLLAIAHPMILRAAIANAVGAGPSAFRQIDIAPLSRVTLSGGGGRWTLSALIPPKDAA